MRRRRLRLVVAAVAFVAASTVAFVAASTVAVGRAAFERRIGREMDELLAAGVGTDAAVVTEADLAGPPEPVRRPGWAGVVGTRRPAVVRLTQEGRFRQGEGRAWVPFTAEEVSTTDPPGFVWSTTMRFAPGVPSVGRDRDAGGRGSIERRLLGLVPVAEARGEELDRGALPRYLNETMWFPAAVLDPSIAWQGTDGDSARATVGHGGVTAAATFVFDAQGRPVDVVAERHDLSRGRLETWSTPITAYGEFGGVRIPTEGQGVWRYEDGDFASIEPRVTGVAYGESAAR